MSGKVTRYVKLFIVFLCLVIVPTASSMDFRRVGVIELCRLIIADDEWICDIARAIKYDPYQTVVVVVYYPNGEYKKKLDHVLDVFKKCGAKDEKIEVLIADEEILKKNVIDIPEKEGIYLWLG